MAIIISWSHRVHSVFNYQRVQTATVTNAVWVSAHGYVNCFTYWPAQPLACINSKINSIIRLFSYPLLLQSFYHGITFYRLTIPLRHFALLLRGTCTWNGYLIRRPLYLTL